MAAIKVIMIIAIILLFVVMVLSAIASNQISGDKPTKEDIATAHKYSMISAVVTGLAALLFFVVLIIYWNSDTIRSKAGDAFARLGARIRQQAAAGDPAAIAAVQGAVGAG